MNRADDDIIGLADSLIYSHFPHSSRIVMLAAGMAGVSRPVFNIPRQSALVVDAQRGWLLEF
jgi:hypothetical protein